MKRPFVVILGIAQDGGVPHCGCNGPCCKKAWKKISMRCHATSFGIIDPITHERWVIDATPDFKFQLAILDKIAPCQKKEPIINGILLTHGHVGHYTGLICLEKAILNTKQIPVFTMPKMRKLLVKNFPWKKLITDKNIKIKSLKNNIEVRLNNRVSIFPFLVPHRDEYSETVGFIIKGPKKKILIIPDIDSWNLFNKIDSLIKDVDFAFIDGTFFNGQELPGRDLKTIPHPFIEKSIERFKKFTMRIKKKIFFIHLNHTNPVLIKKNKEHQFIIKNGFNIAIEKATFKI